MFPSSVHVQVLPVARVVETVTDRIPDIQTQKKTM